MISINKTVGVNYKSNPNDVLVLKKALKDIGYYKVPEYGLTPYVDEYLFSSLKKFQKDNKLKVDAIAGPDGETMATINKILGQPHPSVRSPTYICPVCGAPHGGVYGDLCPDCTVK